ncbi:MAG: hypothetical protein ABL870_13070 [Sediminibacterium sp.]
MGEGDLSQIGKAFIWGGSADNISQDPAVIYAMAFFPAIGLVEFFGGKIFYGLLALCLAVLPWAANIASVTRASIGLSLVTTFSVAIYLLVKNRVRNKSAVAGSILIVGGVVIVLGEDLFDFFQSWSLI